MWIRRPDLGSGRPALALTQHRTVAISGGFCPVSLPFYYGGVRGDETRVVTAYANWLQQGGWTVQREVDFADVYAERGKERVYAEAKGRTAAIGLDAGTLYGQLLRRMKDPAPGSRYAVVVPTAAVNAALRVPAWVRTRLAVDIYEVDDLGDVHPHP
jgi:hypothetical protein